MELEKPNAKPPVKADSSDDEFGLSSIEKVTPAQPKLDYSKLKRRGFLVSRFINMYENRRCRDHGLGFG